MCAKKEQLLSRGHLFTTGWSEKTHDNLSWGSTYRRWDSGQRVDFPQWVKSVQASKRDIGTRWITQITHRGRLHRLFLTRLSFLSVGKDDQITMSRPFYFLIFLLWKSYWFFCLASRLWQLLSLSMHTLDEQTGKGATLAKQTVQSGV